MCIGDLPDMCAFISQAPGVHIRQIPHADVTTITCIIDKELRIAVPLFLPFSIYNLYIKPDRYL